MMGGGSGKINCLPNNNGENSQNAFYDVLTKKSGQRKLIKSKLSMATFFALSKYIRK